MFNVCCVYQQHTHTPRSVWTQKLQSVNDIICGHRPSNSGAGPCDSKHCVLFVSLSFSSPNVSSRHAQHAVIFMSQSRCVSFYSSLGETPIPWCCAYFRDQPAAQMLRKFGKVAPVFALFPTHFLQYTLDFKMQWNWTVFQCNIIDLVWIACLISCLISNAPYLYCKFCNVSKKVLITYIKPDCAAPYLTRLS